MSKARSSSYPRRDPLSARHDLPNALGRDPVPRRQSPARAGKGRDQAKSQQIIEQIAYKRLSGGGNLRNYLLLRLLKKGVLERRGHHCVMTMAFLAKVADRIVKTRELPNLDVKNSEILHGAISSAVTHFYGGTYSDEIFDCTNLIEEMIDEDIEFKLNNR